MWTLTYRGEGVHDLDQMRRHVERFLAKVRVDLRDGFAYLWVPELHKSGHGLHVHMAVPMWFDQRRLAELWGHGFVWCSDMKPKGLCAVAGSQRAAAYLSKYVGKAFEVAAFGRHRYERAQGYEIVCVKTVRYDMDDGREYAELYFGLRPFRVWTSEEAAEWKGPPVVVLFFMGTVPDG